MIVSDELIDQLSLLARLEFKNEEFSEIKKDFNKILNFVKILDQIDTAKIKPLSHISSEVNVLRDDLIVDYKCKKSALKNSPAEDSDYFKVSKVIKKYDQ